MTYMKYTNNKSYIQKNQRLGSDSKNVLMEGLNMFNGTNLTLILDLDEVK